MIFKPSGQANHPGSQAGAFLKSFFSQILKTKNKNENVVCQAEAVGFKKM